MTKTLLLVLSVLCVGFEHGFASDFYISPDGSDMNAGTKDAPFATLYRARNTIRTLNADHTENDGNVTVHLREGVYRLSETFELDSRDSGRSDRRIIYSSFPGESVTITGGFDIPSSEFRPVQNPDILDRIICSEARRQIRKVNLKELGINDFGELKQYGFPRIDVPAPLELVFNGEFMQLARWPNEETLQFHKIIKSGSAPRYDRVSDKKPVFEYTCDQPLKWRQAEDIWLYGILHQPWAPDFVKVDRIDHDNKHVTLVQDHHYGLNSNVFTWYYYMNILEEIDKPGEWYLDRASGWLFFWPPGDIESAEISVTVFSDQFMVHLEDASYIEFQNITFELSRRDGIKIEGGQNNYFAGCTFRNMGGWAAVIDGGPELLGNEPQIIETKSGTGNGLLSCDIYNMGQGGISIGGGDRKTLRSGNNYATNNHIRNCSRRIQTYTPAIRLNGVGNKAANNLIHNMPQFGISFSGNDHIIEQNEIHHVALDYSDAGAVYTASNPLNRGTVIRHNFFHHIGLEREKVLGVYIDYANCGTIVTGNVFYKLVAEDDFGAVMINGGNDNRITNNIFVDCRMVMHVSNFLNGWGYDWLDGFLLDQWKNDYKRLNAGKPPYSKRYPELIGFLNDNHRIPERNIFENNLIYNSQDVYRERYEADIQKKNNYITDTDPGFKDISKMNFQLAEDSIVFEKIPEFKMIPFEKIGLYNDDYRKLRGDSVRYAGISQIISSQRAFDNEPSSSNVTEVTTHRKDPYDPSEDLSLSPQQRAWELVLKQNLGDFYYPRYLEARARGEEQAWDYVEDNPKLPRVLLIGDSISRGYTVPVRHALAGKANLHRAPANCGSTQKGLRDLSVWLGDAQWDVIVFNFGIHDRATSPPVYRNNLEKLISRLQETGAKLLWVTTTPIPAGADIYIEGATDRVNSDSINIMKSNGIPILDLHTYVLPIIDRYQLLDNCHFNEEGYTYMGKRVASEIEALLRNVQED